MSKNPGPQRAERSEERAAGRAFDRDAFAKGLRAILKDRNIDAVRRAIAHGALAETRICPC